MYQQCVLYIFVLVCGVFEITLGPTAGFRSTQISEQLQVGTDGEKNIDWIDTDNRLTKKNIDQVDGLQKKQNLKPMDRFYRENKFFGPMIDTIGQK